jgi:hypothetical protein
MEALDAADLFGLQLNLFGLCLNYLSINFLVFSEPLCFACSMPNPLSGIAGRPWFCETN